MAISGGRIYLYTLVNEDETVTYYLYKSKKPLHTGQEFCGAYTHIKDLPKELESKQWKARPMKESRYHMWYSVDRWEPGAISAIQLYNTLKRK